MLSSTEHNTFIHLDCENGNVGTGGFKWNGGSVLVLALAKSNKKVKNIEHSFAMLNLRGDAAEFKQQAKWISSFSYLVIFMIDLVNVNLMELSVFSRNIDKGKSLVDLYSW